MVVAFLVALVLLAMMFAAASISQSYAASRQAQAAIEAAQAAQVASAGNLLLSVALVLLVLLLLVAVTALLWARYHTPRTTENDGGTWAAGPNARWSRREIQESPANLLTSMQTLIMMQMIQQMQQQPRVSLPATPATDSSSESDDDFFKAVRS